MTAPTSFPGGKPEASGTRGSAALAEDIHRGMTLDALESIISLVLIAIVVWLWLRSAKP